MGQPLHHVFIRELQLLPDLPLILVDLVPDPEEGVVVGDAIGEAVRMGTRLQLEQAVVEAVLEGFEVVLGRFVLLCQEEPIHID